MDMSTSSVIAKIVLLMALLCGLPSLQAQQPDITQEPVKLNFGGPVELSILIKFISNKIGVKILYDEQVANKKITINAPGEITATSLLEVLQSALKFKGLALVDADVAGWKKIVVNRNLTTIAKPAGELDFDPANKSQAVTQTFRLKHAKAEKIAVTIKPFLTEPGANVITIPEQNLLIITDYAGNLTRISKLIETVDQASPTNTVSYYQAKHVEASELSKQIIQTGTARTQSGTSTQKVQALFDERTNKLILVGTEAMIKDALKLVETLDVSLGLITESYSFRFVAAERIDNLVQQLIDPLTQRRSYRSAIDADSNTLVVTAPESVHERIELLINRLDIEGSRAGSKVKFYKLKHAGAEEVLQTLVAIQQGSSGGVTNAGLSGFGNARGVTTFGRGNNTSVFNQPQARAGVPNPANNPFPVAANPTRQNPNVPREGQAPVNNPEALDQDDIQNTQNARLTADPLTNSIIVVGDPPAQEIFKELIEYLDKRRPQVMLECRVIVIDTSDDYSVGVELSAGDRSGVERLIQFTSFGLSTVDATTGALSLVPGAGLNASLFSPEDGDAVLRALAVHSRARVLSVPRILVDDNSTGSLASVTEEPFISLNSFNNGGSSSSFAGFAEAGTNIEVTPRISDNDYLSLDYVITVNNFTGTGTDGAPPPRQTDEIRSTVTIPDGHTVIVGGLNRKSSSVDLEGIPILENIPVIRRLTSMEGTADGQTTLYVFLKPVILRDDKFEDLKHLSDVNVRCAGSCPDYPESKPVLVR